MASRLRLAAILVFSLTIGLGLAGVALGRGSVEEESAKWDGIYTGTATRVENNCWDDGMNPNHCEQCSTQDNIELRREDGKITLNTVGVYIFWNPQSGRCQENPSTNRPAWKFTGSYEMTEKGIYSFQLNDCNDGHPASGTGYIIEGKINVGFSCPGSPEGNWAGNWGDNVEWQDCLLTRQSDGAVPATDGGAASGAATNEVSTAPEESDFVQEGQTDEDLTVDRVVGDATVEKGDRGTNRHTITTLGRSKVKIHYGNTSMVVGPNSHVRVTTKTNRLGQPVIMWEFLNPEAVIYVKDEAGTRQVQSGVPETEEVGPRVFINVYRSIMIFYNGSYQGKTDLREFYGGESNQTTFTGSDGERFVYVGIRGTEYYFQAAGDTRTVYLTEGEVDLYTAADPEVTAMGAGTKASVDDKGDIGPAGGYSQGEIDALAREADLTEPAGSRWWLIALLAAGGVAAAALITIGIVKAARTKTGKTRMLPY